MEVLWIHPVTVSELQYFLVYGHEYLTLGCYKNQKMVIENCGKIATVLNLTGKLTGSIKVVHEKGEGGALRAFAAVVSRAGLLFKNISSVLIVRRTSSSITYFIFLVSSRAVVTFARKVTQSHSMFTDFPCRTISPVLSAN